MMLTLNNLFEVKRMKKFDFLSLIFVGFLMIFSFSAVKAQDEMPPDAPNKQAERVRRPNLFAELGLTQVQRQQIRRVNMEKRPLVRAAQQRLLETTKNLDQAIYADTVNESEIQARLKDVQTAQGELIKINFTNELAVRKILTAEQFAKFRILRQQFAQSMGDNPNHPQKRRMQNLRQRFKLRRNQMRPNN
jgi:Spy/CpxP family protein refolding chaperone